MIYFLKCELGVESTNEKGKVNKFPAVFHVL